MDDETINDMIDNAGYVEGLRPQWSDSVKIIQRLVDIHTSNLLRNGGYTREAHKEVDEINKHWARILQG